MIGGARSGSMLGRRRLFHIGGAAAATMAASTLVGCRSTATAGNVAPQPAQPVTTVYFQINWQQGWNKTALELCQEFTDTNFNAQHKGVRAVPMPWGNASGVLAEVLAGNPQTPAVVSSCCGDFATAQPMLARLDPLLKQDNMPTSLWSEGQLVTYQMPDGLYGVPAYTACQPLIYSQSIFDELGLPYPDPGWDYQEATRIWTQLAGAIKNGWRYATTMQFYPNNYDGQVYLHKGFGGELMDATKTICLLDQAPAIRAGQWIYPLVWDKVIINRGGFSFSGATALRRGVCGMYQSAGDMLYDAVTNLGTAAKWDVIPMPSWPVRRGTNVQVDYYAVNAQYPDQNLAWELFKFVAAGKETNRFLIGATLSFPNLSSMWDEWMSIVRSAAPVTQNKHIEYWAEAAQQGYGYGHEFFLYDPTQALNAMSPILQQMWDNRLDPAQGYRMIAQQINALEQAAKSGLARGAKTATLFPTQGPAIAGVPPGV